VRNKTEEIAAYAAKVARVHGQNHPENIDIFNKFATLSNEMIEHLEAEESTVFPLIKKISEKLKNGETLLETEKEKLKGQLSLMEDDHDGAGQLIADIRKLSNDFTPPADACRTYHILYQNLAGFEEDLHKHVHLENNILFKKAENLIAA
jgi:regulator of cell morphogenesis and NO signaling